MVVSHSILNGGPGCYFLQPWFYEAVAGEDDQEKLLGQMTVEDIPLNSSSSNLVDFIKNMDLIKTQEKIDKIVDENIQILNSSTWDPTVQITTENKDLLISKLIFDELFLKRRSQLKSICEGLELSGLLSYIRKYPIFCRKIFVSDLDPLTAQNILDIVVMENEETFEKKQSQFFFLQYVKEADRTKLSNILQFVTDFTRISPGKMEKGIILKYLEYNDEKMLPESMACLNILYLSTVHSNQISFNKYFNRALEFEASGFSAPYYYYHI